MSKLTDKKIAIVGGGPGGLTLARLLQMKGVDVSVYERDADASARPQGATLDLHDESGLRALREAGLIHEFNANYRPGADRMHLMDSNATTITEEDIDKEGANARPEIDRGPLQNILLNSLQPGTVVWDSHFVAMTEQNQIWRLQFKNGTEAFADIVIAADGANSKIRPYLTDIKPFYAGVTMIEGAVEDSAINSRRVHKLLNGGKIFAFGNQQNLIVSSKGDGSLVFYLSFKACDKWIAQSGLDFNSKEQMLDWFKTDYATWADVWTELLENSTGKFVPRTINCMPLDQTWQTRPNLTMLGDAAHLMPPFAGEGVNMAMLDAVELCHCLMDDTHADAHAAIVVYEKQMLARASAAAEMSLASTDALHSDEAITFMTQVVEGVDE